MPEPLKNVYTQEFIQDLAQKLAPLDSGFNRKDFIAKTLSDLWLELELKARMSKISDCIHDFLTGDFATNAEVLSSVAVQYRQSGSSGFEQMFLPHQIEKHGLKHSKVSMKALAEITETGSAEFAIRPFLIEHESKTLKQMMRWAKSADEHLRRLASEGCRPRLPWAMALPAYKQDPSSILPILDTLKTDPSLYVRRSVANNLNDISKDNPELALDLAYEWRGISEETDWLIKHACRGLLKAAHPRSLALFGFSPPDKLKLSQFKLSEKNIRFGEPLTLSAKLSSAQPLSLLRVEYGIDFVKANGSLSRKVFKLSESELQADSVDIKKTHKFVPISTRVHYSGKHYIALIINGIELAKRPFHLEMVD